MIEMCRMEPAPRLLDVPLVALSTVDVDEANYWVERWGHELGACDRPFHSEGYLLSVGAMPKAVAISASTVSATAAGYERAQLVELARLCAAGPWLNRVMLRLWREVCGPRFRISPDSLTCEPPSAAVSYSTKGKTGNLYRLDGWTKVSESAGSSGGGQWSRKRDPNELLSQAKSLWLWRYDALAPATTDRAPAMPGREDADG